MGKGFVYWTMPKGSDFSVCRRLSFPKNTHPMPWAPTHRITVGYSSPVYRKIQLKEEARQPFPNTAREVRMIVWSREKGMRRGSVRIEVGGTGFF